MCGGFHIFLLKNYQIIDQSMIYIYYFEGGGRCLYKDDTGGGIIGKSIRFSRNLCISCYKLLVSLIKQL